VSDIASPNVPVAGTRTRFFPGLTAALFLVLYLPVLLPLAKQWIYDSNYQHGLAVPLVSAFILWRRRAILGATGGNRSAFAGWTLILLASLLLIGGTAASELFTARFSLPLMLIGILLVLRGREFVRRAAFPLLFLFMMIPLPYIIYYKLTFPMQLMSAKLSAAFLRSIGVDVIQRGNILSLPNYTLEVVAACSGLRSLMTMITLSLILTAFTEMSVRRKAILAASSVPIAIIANTIRLAVMAIGAYAVSPAFVDGILHEISGLIVFSVGFVMLLIVRGLLKWKRQ
jgi:exosortase